MPMKNNKYRIIPYPSEHVVVDEEGNKVVSCPTEQEAKEYITEVLEGEAELSPYENGRQCERKEPVHNMKKSNSCQKKAIKQHSPNNDILGGISSED